MKPTKPINSIHMSKDLESAQIAAQRIQLSLQMKTAAFDRALQFASSGTETRSVTQVIGDAKEIERYLLSDPEQPRIKTN